MNFKEKFVSFIMKKWTAPTVCGICILLIFVMSVNSFAKYYTRVQEARAASVAVYCANVGNYEQIWTLGQVAAGNGYALQEVTALTGNDQYNVKKGRVIIYLGTKHSDEAGQALPYDPNSDYAFLVSNKLGEKICEVALSYTITITFPDSDNDPNNNNDILPKGVTWTLEGSDQEGTHYSNTHKSQTFTSSSFTLPAGVHTTNTHKIKFYGTGIDYTTSDKYLEGVTITITTTQTQS